MLSERAEKELAATRRAIEQAEAVGVEWSLRLLLSSPPARARPAFDEKVHVPGKGWVDVTHAP